MTYRHRLRSRGGASDSTWTVAESPPVSDDDDDDSDDYDDDNNYSINNSSIDNTFGRSQSPNLIAGHSTTSSANFVPVSEPLRLSQSSLQLTDVRETPPPSLRLDIDDGDDDDDYYNGDRSRSPELPFRQRLSTLPMPPLSPSGAMSLGQSPQVATTTDTQARSLGIHSSGTFVTSTIPMPPLHTDVDGQLQQTKGSAPIRTASSTGVPRLGLAPTEIEQQQQQQQQARKKKGTEMNPEPVTGPRTRLQAKVEASLSKAKAPDDNIPDAGPRDLSRPKRRRRDDDRRHCADTKL